MKYTILVLLLFSSEASAKVWHVGSSESYKVPSAVMPLVASGDTVEIDPGLYTGDVGTWSKDSLVLRCVSGYAHLEAAGNIAQRKGIWVIDGKHTYVEGIEFSGAAISEADGGNGAGIRLEGLGFECRRCSFHDNQEGILTGNDTTNDVLIESCSFDHNGVETGAVAGFEHNIYVGRSRSFTVKFSYFHSSIIGHEIKTRANTNYILYNHIVDGPTGDGSYSIDLPQGGLGIIMGNTIEKGPSTANSTVIDYGAEWKSGVFNPDSELYFVNNTVVTDRTPTTFFNIAAGTKVAEIANNIFAGGTHILGGVADTLSNLVLADTASMHFANVMAYDYHLTANSPAANGAVTLASVHGFVLSPVSEYREPMDSEVRANDRTIGAFAFGQAGVAQDIPLPSKTPENYPNPFTNSTEIVLPSGFRAKSGVAVSLYDARGELSLRKEFPTVIRSVIVGRSNLPEGIYYYTIVSLDGEHACEGSVVIGK